MPVSSEQIESAAESARPRLHKYTTEMNNYSTRAMEIFTDPPGAFRAFTVPNSSFTG
jgi:hypothetical protein